ncbi:MAG: Domain related to MnhB subunit of Na+/H+ antiporter [Candidatus Argoarchaeum ethanivorans]|uniref:Domain related to MnhB subunit of Na+/H+ antiporter n=1 Tax=Candidatus Argoarchaeum ethanivorans TaxID=2608793 RepID=A0A811TB83_9EURY|nr:MAG: Domain related to MnhB subunit of Na+/H+ antiporter [Candidatus Argoarchaeum ethanivorans]
MNRERDVIIETVSRLMIPFIQLFALYVIIHGAGGPGGGFQGGVIFGSSFVLFIIAFGITAARKKVSERVNTALSALGVSIYAVVGLLCIISSLGVAQYLNYGYLPLPFHFEERRALGMDFVEIGIGITVMAIVTSIFFDLAWKEEDEGDSE